MGGLGPGFRPRLRIGLGLGLQHVVVEDDEQRCQTAMEARTDSLQQSLDLNISEICRKLLNGLDEVESENSTVGGSRCRCELEKWPRLIGNDLKPRPDVGLLVPLAEGLQNGNSTKSDWSDAVSN